MTDIHVTGRRAFKECRARYKYSTIERLRPISETVDALFIGSGGHHALRRYYESRIDNRPFTAEDLHDAFFEYVDIILQESGRAIHIDEETKALVTGILQHYLEYYQEPDSKWEIVAVEKTMTYEVLPGVRLTGTVDLVVKYQGYYYIVDHKFLRSISESLTEQLEMDDQMTAYLFLASKDPEMPPIRGCIYNVIRKKVPVVPDQLQRGGLTKRANIDTTYDVYKGEIDRLGLDPKDYEDILEALRTKPSNFFRRELVVRNKKEIEHFHVDLEHELKDMTNPETYFYPSPGQACGWCGFRTLCKGEREGADTEYTRKHLYRIKQISER